MRVTSDTAKVLFVDDEQRVLTSMRAMFRREYQVFIANSGAEALAVMRDNRIDVVVSDQRMPEMSGVEVLKEVKQIAPDSMRILLTGYADLDAIESAINDSEVFRYLMKPCPRDELRETIALAVDAARERRTEPAANEPIAAPDEAAIATATMPADETLELYDTVELAAAADAAPADVAKEKKPERRAAPEKPAAREDPAASEAPDAPPAEPAATTSDATVELLVLSDDTGFFEGIMDAANGARRVHRVSDVAAAVEHLSRHPVGVLITDAAVDEQEVSALTTELKRHVPELITIVASDRSDAHMLINLINHGQVFRFLLKPLSIGQCRIWLQSAVNKHLELVSTPSVVKRYVVSASNDNDEAEATGVLTHVMSGMRRIRSRLLRPQRTST